VAEWDISTEAHSAKNKDGGLPLWRKALFLPAAKQMASLAELAKSIDFWQLQPQPNFIATQPGLSSAGRYIAAAGTEGKDVSLIYVPEDRTLEVLLEALPPSPLVSWFNPRTGEKSPAVAVVGGRSCQFPTPDPGDWVLVMRGAKKVN
jgi:hypothetical protein